MKTTQYAIDPWYAEQEQRIRDYGREARRLREERRALFDPGYLYVVEFDSGVIKVGKAGNAEARLSAHSKTGFVRASWASLEHLYCSKTERQLIARCAERGSLHGGRAYLVGIDFTWACGIADVIVSAGLRQAVDDGEIPHTDLAALRREARVEAWKRGTEEDDEPEVPETDA